eukprot:GEMP01113518.1.p1 GENE.GEMP01113518.1~~GEMP01113518.1.p1  ORF type:complete len:151 (+),score=35.76 GEMP01113518.1:24-476(+)
MPFSNLLTFPGSALQSTGFIGPDGEVNLYGKDLGGSRLNKETQLHRQRTLSSPADLRYSFSPDSVTCAAKAFRDFNVAILSRTNHSNKFPPKVVAHRSDTESCFRDCDPPPKREVDLSLHWTRTRVQKGEDYTTFPPSRTFTQPGYWRSF